MPLVEVNTRGIATEHAGDLVSIPMWNLGGAVQFEHVTRRVIARNRAARFHRHAGMAADAKFKRDDGMCAMKAGIDIAEFLADQRRLGRAARLEFARRRVGRKQHRQVIDFDLDEVGRVFGDIGVFCENNRDRLADISHAAFGEHALPIGFQSLDPREPKINRGNIYDVRFCPHRNYARQRQCRADVDRFDHRMRSWRTRNTHMQLKRKRNIGGKAAAPGHQRLVFEPNNRAADEAHQRDRISAAAARTALMMF